MKGFFSKITRVFSPKNKDYEEEEVVEDGYVELEAETSVPERRLKIKLLKEVDNSDMAEDIQDLLRTGRYIVIFNISKLRDNDYIELKRITSRVNKTVNATGGNILGFGNDWVIATPSGIKIQTENLEKQDEDVEIEEF